jgi:hypothetical protein
MNLHLINVKTHIKVWQENIPLKIDNQTSIMKFISSNNTASLFSIGLNSDFIVINMVSIPSSYEDLREAIM